jgi:hypothetical protein
MAGGLPPPPTRAASGDFAWTAWYNQLYKLLSSSGSISWDLVNKAGSSIADLANKAHNLLTGMQGGAANEYYHLTATEHTFVQTSLSGGGMGGSGHAGAPGIDGLDGEDSFPIPGPVGPKGNTGATGPAGPQGFGVDGTDGEDGIAIPGSPGAPGNPGPTGPQGPIGFGLEGDQGEDGIALPGPQGPPGWGVAIAGYSSSGYAIVLPDIYGSPGVDGTDGEDGLPIPGPVGPQGNIGPTGLQGLAGPAIFLQADEAEEAIPLLGPQGPRGTTGTTGPQGPQGFGVDGSDGEDGMSIPGTPGASGNPGSTGPQGPIGFAMDGETGEDGIPGPIGPQGIQGSIGVTGNTGPQGAVGPAVYLESPEADEPLFYPGSQGPQGPSGTNGSTGGQGPQGPAAYFTQGTTDDLDIGSESLSYTIPDNFNPNFASVNTGQLAGFRNKIINGAMLIDQRNSLGSPINTSGLYSTDRFMLSKSGTAVFSLGQSTTAPIGFKNSLVATVTTSATIAAGEFYDIIHCIEGYNTADLNYGTANAVTCTLSFWVRSSITGIYSYELRNNALNRSIVFNYTIASANVWQKVTQVISGDTTGTWATDNTAGIQIVFPLATGSTFTTATIGSWQATNSNASTTAITTWINTNGNTFYITGIQFEVGTVSTPYEQHPYALELSLCQRYYEVCSFLLNSALTVFVTYPYKVTKRAAPTLTLTPGSGTGGTVSVGTGADQTQSFYQNTAHSVATFSTVTALSEIL